MADTQKTRFSFGVVDQLGTRATVTLYALVDPTSTVQHMSDTKDTVAALIEATLGAGVVESRISLDATEADVADAGSRVEQTAVLDYIVTSSGRLYGVALPGWLSSLVGAGGQPTIGAGAGAALVAGLTGALTGGASGVWTSNDFLPLGALKDAFLSFRKRRKSLTRSSEEPAP